MAKLQTVQVVKEDSIATNTSLRTPIKQIEFKEPAYLKTVRKPKPKKIVYQTWSKEDSVYFNLVEADNKDFFDHSLEIVPTESETTTKQMVAITNDTIESTKEISIAEKSDSIATTAVLKTFIPAPPVSLRKKSPFQDSKDWFSVFILLVIVIAGIIKVSSGKYLSDLITSIRYQQSAAKLHSNYNVQHEKTGWALNILFFLSSSMLIYEYAGITGLIPLNISNFTFFLLVLTGVILYFIIKNLLYHIVAFVFDAQKSTQEYLFNANMLSKAYGVLSIPIISVVPFVDILTATLLLKGALTLFLIMYFIQLLRGARIILHNSLSIFYMFLYFCALEILPLSILIKIMIY